MDKTYWELFFGESQEYLSQINTHLVELEKNPSSKDAIDEIFRLMHTLKGMAATMGFSDFAELAHSLEDVFDVIRSGKKTVNSEVMDVVFSCVDAFSVMLEELRLEQKTNLDILPYTKRVRSILSKKESSVKEKKAVSLEKDPMKIDLTPAELSIVSSKKKLDLDVFSIDISISSECQMKGTRACLVIIRVKQLGEIIKTNPCEEDLKDEKFADSFSIILATKEEKSVLEDELSRVLEIDKVVIASLDANIKTNSQETTQRFIKKIQSMRIPVERLDKIMNFMGELSIAKSRLVQILQTKEVDKMEDTVFIVDRLVSSLQDEVLQMRLLPISYTLDAFPRIIRDIGKRSGKDVDLDIKGSEIELDRVILDDIGDPLIHILRNAIDHGIEDQETRKGVGKDPKGRISISVSREKGHVIIEVSDDGKGINFDSVAKKAIEKGLISEQDAKEVDSQKILEIMTSPGFSTKSEVSDLSGRGVGLDVAKAKLDHLGGRLDFETELGKGTKFILVLPLTLAIIKAMLVKVGDQIFAIPLMSIRESVRIRDNEIKTIERMEVIKIRDEIIPLIRLDKELGIVHSKKNDKLISVVIVEGRVKNLGLCVDSIIGEQDVVVKPLGSMVRKTKGIAGGTILGDGEVALILDIVNLH